MRIRTALVTARSAPAHERAIRTLMDWNIEVDQAMFLGGLAKVEFLRELAQNFHTWYNASQFIVEDAATRNARLGLALGVQQVMRNGLSLLGASAPESM